LVKKYHRHPGSTPACFYCFGSAKVGGFNKTNQEKRIFFYSKACKLLIINKYFDIFLKCVAERGIFISNLRDEIHNSEPRSKKEYHREKAKLLNPIVALAQHTNRLSLSSVALKLYSQRLSFDIFLKFVG